MWNLFLEKVCVYFCYLNLFWIFYVIIHLHCYSYMKGYFYTGIYFYGFYISNYFSRTVSFLKVSRFVGSEIDVSVKVLSKNFVIISFSSIIYSLCILNYFSINKWNLFFSAFSVLPPNLGTNFDHFRSPSSFKISSINLISSVFSHNPFLILGFRKQFHLSRQCFPPL